jgi:large repetitive protein
LGKVGASIILLGTNLTGTTSVSFNGTNASFTVVSSSEITTTVPTAVTTGSVTVVTPQGTLKSNVVFRVTPQIKQFSPPSGPVGTVVTITGVSLKQTEAIYFGGVKATAFKVFSDTEEKVKVPAGAITAPITITTPGGTATSSGTFTVR